MKKKLLSVIMLGTMLTMASVTGCGSSSQNTAAEADTETETDTEAGTAAKDSDAVVKPVYPLETEEDALADGGYSVSFTADDLAKTDDGYELTVEVYGYDEYEMDAIDKLTHGDTIQYCNQDIVVDKVEKEGESRYVTINGGVENDEISLKEEDGLYCAVTAANDYPVYYSVGKVTILLSEDVTFEDQAYSEQESEVPVVELKDLPAAIENSELPFDCYSTVITVRQEQIVQIIRYWTP